MTGKRNEAGWTKRQQEELDKARAHSAIFDPLAEREMPGINRMSTNERIRMFAAYQGNNPMLKRAARDARKLLANPNPHWRRMLNEDLH